MKGLFKLKGKVVNDRQEPLEDVVITILSGPGQFKDIAALTNEEGIFSFDDLSDGPYLLKFMDDENSFEKSIHLGGDHDFFVIQLE